MIWKAAAAGILCSGFALAGTDAPASASFSLSPSATHTTGVNSFTATGSGTTWSGSNPFSISSGPATGLTNYVRTDDTHASFDLTVTALSGAIVIADSNSSSTQNITAAVVVPDAPTIGVVTASTDGSDSAAVNGTAPADDGGATISSYTATSTPGSISATNATLPVTVTGLTRNTAYTFNLVATNSVGDSPASAESSSVTPTSPPGDWYDLAWLYRKEIVIDPGTVSADLTGFPMMVVRTDDLDMVTAQRNGQDIVFTDDDGTKLAHELLDCFIGVERDAGWVWFARPAALRYVGTNDHTYLTYQKNDGAITIIQWDHNDGEAASTPFDLHAPGDTPNLFVQEDHGPAGLLVRASDQRLMAFYAGHSGPGMYMRVSTNPEDATAWATEVNLDSQLGLSGYSYANPVQFADGTIWLIYRCFTGTTPTRWYYSQSTDNGTTWSAGTEFFTTNAYGYVQFVQSGDTLFFHCNPDHPRLGTSNSLYAFKYIKGTGWRTMGGSTLTLPFAEANLSGARIYNGADPDGRCWLWDIALGADGHPRVLYARIGDTAHHLMHYARWTGSAWVDTFLVDSGGHIGSYNPDDANYQDDWYSGGAGFDYSDPDVVFLSREISGVHEIYQYDTADDGATWSPTAITTGSKHRNFRPVVPRDRHENAKLFWRQGPQPDYTRHLTGIGSLPQSLSRVVDVAARVKVDITASGGATLYMYWGNAAASAQEDRTAVWAAADKLVHHGREAYDVVTTKAQDSTSNANHGTKRAANRPYEAAGKASRASYFGGADYIDFGSGINMAGQSAITVLAGVKYAGSPALDEHTVLSNWSGGGSNGSGFLIRIDPGTTPAHKLEAFAMVGTDTQIGGTSSLVITPDTWAMTALTYDTSGGLIAWKNKTKETLAAAAGSMDAGASANLFAGRYSALFPLTEWFTGSMEAVLISFEKKSDAFVEAWYDTWNAPNTFATFGTLENPASGDVTAPTLAGSIAVSSLTATSYTLTCPVAADAVGVTGYQYRLNAGSWVSIAASGRVVSISGRTPASTDAVEMRAHDAALNYSNTLSVSVVLDALSITATLGVLPIWYMLRGVT